MKNRLFTFIFFIFIFSKVISASASLESILMIDVVEAVNLHCKLNNEYHCNPYVVVNFENSSPAMSQSTHKVECTKNPKWESRFRFMPKQCFGKINILIYQFLTPNDISFIGENHLYDEQDYYHGETKVGYLGRVILDLEKLPFGNIDDWFLVETLINKERIQFPSCIHLRLKWTSSVCSEHRSSIYQIIKDDAKIDKQFKPRNYIGMCKKDFAMIYKTRFSRLDTVHPLKNINELDYHKTKKCIRDPYQDFGFNHNSNLTSIEESIAFKIIKRNTGENLNFDQLVNSSTRDNTYVKSYMEFFKNKCFKKEGLDIERINNLLTNEAKNFPENTNNPFVSHNSPLTYNEKMNDIRLKNVYNDTLGQFFILEDIKNLEKMDDNTYFQTLNKFSSKIKEINYEKKIDQTIFEHRNKVKLNGKGMVAKEEYPFFRIYALYKFDGGQLPYDQLKKEFIIRPKLFNKYLSSPVFPTNIIYNFLEDECPFNSVCLDQNGIVMNSKGEDPKLLLMKETNYINDFKDFHFKETIHKKRKNNENTSTVKQIDIVINKNNLEMMKKKEILINKIFDIHPLLGEILGICNIIALNTMKDDIFIKNEENILNKYILMWDSNSRFSRNASSVLLYLITKEDNLLRTDLNFLMEGLTFGDNRSIRVFKEIAITIIIESIINAKLNNYIDLNARAILLRIFNKPFEFKVILKVNFLSIMKISDDFKEKLTFLIMKYESNPTVSFMMENSINSKQTIKSKEISIKNNSNNTINQRFQQYLNHFQEEFIRKVFNQTVNKTNAIKKGKVFMFRQSDDDSLIDKINSIKDEIKSLVIRDKFNSTYPVFPDLQEYDTYQKGVDNRTIYTKLKKHMNNMIKLNQIFNNSINQRKISLLDKFPRFKSLSNKAKLKSESLNSFAKLSFSLLKKELRVPSQKDIFEQMMSNPDTRKMIETALKNKNKVVYSNEHHGSYEIIHRKTTTKTVDKFKKTKEKIKNDVLDEKSFDEFLNQDENSVVNDPTGLFNVLKSIKQRVCSPCFLCIEIGTIYGDWDSLRPKDVEITTKEYEDVNLILKPIIIVNNIESPNKPNDTGITGSNFTIDGERVKIIEDEDCGDFDILKSANMLQIKEKIKPKIQRKFYRHVQIGNENLSKDIFKQGLNIILLERNKAYSKIFEKTFDTNNKACESEELARVIRENSCDKIIILTGIGKWMGSMTPDLIREIKNIGGPDLKNLFSADFQDNQMADHAFLLVGRRGLCMSNGVYRIKNYDIPKSLKPLTPNLSSDPNDCFFEDVSLENMNNRKTEGKFYHVIDFKFKLNLNVDNRFAYNSPAITKVSPFKAHVRGGDLITILGYNFGDNEDNVSEIYIKNVRCNNTKVINKNKITCNSGINIFDRGIGNVIVKLKNGFSSPSKTCDLFEYYGEIPKIINIQDQKKKCVYTSPKIVDSINNLK